MDEQNEQVSAPRSGISRREVLFGGAVAVGGTGLLTGGALAGAMGDGIARLAVEDPFGPSVNGTIGAIELPDRVTLTEINLGVPGDGGEGQRPSGLVVVVKLQPDALLVRTGPAQLSDFQPGDKVIAYGPRWEGEEFTATSLTPLLQVIEAPVGSVSGNQINTTKGALTVHENTDFRSSGEGPETRSMSDIRQGQRIYASFVEDPASGKNMAHAVSVVG